MAKSNKVLMLDTVEDSHTLTDPEEMKVPSVEGTHVDRETAKGGRVVKEVRTCKLYKDVEYTLPASQADELIGLGLGEAK